MKEKSKKNSQDSQKYGYSSEFPTRLRAMMENKNGISPLKRKVSQTELATHLGITRQAVSGYTLGTSVPDMLKFKAIADFFGVNYGYLLGATPVINEEHNQFIERSHLSPSSLNAIINLCAVPEDAISFMLLVETVEFVELINAFTAFLNIVPMGKVRNEDLIKIDASVRKVSGGALRAVPAKLEKDILLMNAQRYLRDAMERVDHEIQERIQETQRIEKVEGTKVNGEEA